MEHNKLWQTALGEIELQISRPNFVTWLKNSQFIDKQDGVALVSLPNNFSKEWVKNKYQKIILAAIRNLDETTKTIKFTVHGNSSNAGSLKNKNLPASEKYKEQSSFDELIINPDTNLNPRYKLSSFVVGKSNELAFAVATAIVENVGKKYNPLYVYGGVGLGKTHLIQAI